MNALMKYSNEQYRDKWEAVRLIRHTISGCLGAKMPVLKFSWDEEENNTEKNKELTNKELVDIQYDLIKSVNK